MCLSADGTRASVVFAVQNWLGESQEAKKTSSQPAYFSVGMSSESATSSSCYTQS